ncbi:hypothetical protein [Lichenibacterium dinghuense]|uniref:hypothetical protein n=1 Tax=Lichenibacterium dinghuense TaxID=2895977 RepID=UPI001F2A8B4C|nr:hypothetical protein [Lichenibacterium sp. 6Y81]
MPDRTCPHRLKPLITLALCAVALIGLVIATTAASRPRAHPGAVAVDHVPPDACVAFYGPGPCREHGSTVVGSTDAVAGPPPATWRGKVGAPTPPEARP